MQKKNTCFEQVPLDTIKKIIEEDHRRQLKVGKPADSRLQRGEDDLLMVATGAHPGGILDRTV